MGCFRPVQGVGFERSCKSAAISGRRAPDQDPCAFCRCRIQWANDARPALSPVSALFRITIATPPTRLRSTAGAYHERPDAAGRASP